jgi:hypothetical protein
VINNELRTRLRRAADLLEALASDPPSSSVPEHDTLSSGSGAEYVDLAAGQMGVSGGIQQVDVGARLNLREAAIREAAGIRRLLSSEGRPHTKKAVPGRDPAGHARLLIREVASSE